MKLAFVKFKSLFVRNIKLYFADKTLFFVSLMAPLILLMLFALFLRGIYYDSFVNSMPPGVVLPHENIPNAFVAGWIVSALMAVSCVTVAMGTGVVMVQDKINGTINDLKATPVSNGMILLAYFLATFISALIITLSVLALGFIFIALSGWYLSVSDVLLIILNTVLLTLFGCGLSVLVNSLVKSEGGVTAVSALSSSVYGFVCGAYMPLSQFGTTFANIFGFNPGLYSAILFKNLFTAGVRREMNVLPGEVIAGLEDAFDINFYFFDNHVKTMTMWLIISGAILVLISVNILLAYKDKFKTKQS